MAFVMNAKFLVKGTLSFSFSLDRPNSHHQHSPKLYAPLPRTTSHTMESVLLPLIDEDEMEEEMEIDNTLAEYISKQTDIALGITRQLPLTEANNSNLVCTPLSMQAVLSFFNPEDSTIDHSLAPELVARVFADGSQRGEPRLSYATGLWVDESVHLEPSLEQAVSTTYNAALNRVNFKTEYEEVRSGVNSWAEKETNDLINDVLDPSSVHSLTRLLFANVLYFKGVWDEKFYASLTKEYDFHLLNGNPVKAVPFMTSWRKQYINVYDGFKVVKLPYRRGRQYERLYSMCLFLPDSKDGLPALVERMCAESGFLERHIVPCHFVRVGEFRIPKFKFSFSFEASNVLEVLGLLRGLTEKVKSGVGEPLFGPSIFHKAVIEVNEEGTEAAAVTFRRISGSVLRLGPIKLIDFVADHPFMFVIREEVTGTVLFIGYVLNPLLQA